MSVDTQTQGGLFSFEEKEAAYRKGFQHGYAAALGDHNLLAKLGDKYPTPLSRCLDFVRTTLYKWRSTNLDRVIPPPMMDQ